MNMDQLRRLAIRASVARRVGVRFMGTSRFKVPRAVRLGGQARTLTVPDDKTLGYDIINVWLDDDYGLSDTLPPVKTVLDVGGNVGFFSLWAWHHFPNAQIHVYEPNPTLLPYLSTNLSGLTTIQVFPEGIASRDGRAHLSSRESSRLVQTRLDETGDVEITGIRRAVERLGGRVDLMKLDCEGAEWDIFSQPRTICFVRDIRMEYHLIGSRTIKDLYAAADHINFDITYLRENENYGIAWLRNKNCLNNYTVTEVR